MDEPTDQPNPDVPGIGGIPSYAVSLYRPNAADARERLQAGRAADSPSVAIGADWGRALLAWPNLGLHVALNPELFMFLFFPPIFFVDGWRMPNRELWRLRGPVLTLAVGLVLFTVVGAGFSFTGSYRAFLCKLPAL